ncbi:MAG TPA: hypothetical protein VHS09_00355 [Polyangiaceae bacterium]|nr:hypothetical protein [Polyangiaceae bacterium]
MLLPVRDLVRRWRGPRSRALAVDAVRARLAEAARTPASDETVALARELRALKPEVLAAFDGVRACGGCAKGRSMPHGRWDGGFCCGGRTEGVFDAEETAALALAGTRPRDLRAPGGDHAGCAFRGPEGCSLDARDRPAVCVRFVCRELEGELREGGEWDRVRALTRRLESTFARFVRTLP